MGIFKDVYCANSNCGEKTKLLTRTRLNDGNYLCGKCTERVPSYMSKSIDSHYYLEDFKAFQRYVEYSDTVLRPMFTETHKYYSLHIDTEHEIFYIGDWIDDKTLFFQFDHLEDFDLVYHAEEFKEGMVGDKVYGRLLLKIKMGYPYFYFEKQLDTHVKAKAKKSFFGSKVEYENPKGMDEFLLYFVETWKSSLTKAEIEDELDKEMDSVDAASDELTKAMALFMFDDLTKVTMIDLKAQRNLLLKTFHPDKAETNNEQYAQKINSAYEVLKKHIEP